MNGREPQRVTLLTNLLGKDETFTPGKKYNEAISVKNSGTIDTFVRVILTKSWQDEEGKKNTTLSPDLIELNFLTDNGWQVAKDQSYQSEQSEQYKERTVLYYTKAVAAGDSTPALSDTTPNQSVDCIGCNKACRWQHYYLYLQVQWLHLPH